MDLGSHPTVARFLQPERTPADFMVLHLHHAGFAPEQLPGSCKVPPTSFFTPGPGLIRALSRFMTVHYLSRKATHQFIKCLESLPNLHTLEVGSRQFEDRIRPHELKKAFVWRVKLPQIKTLIIPESAYPLLKRCPNVEDVVWVITDEPTTSDKFLRALPPSFRSKVKRLTIPLVLPCNPSRG